MKPQLFTVTAILILLVSETSHAGDGFFKELGRNLGYGVSDGYHAQRYCLNAGESCGSCSPVQQPIIPQQMVPQPMIQQHMIQQPMIHRQMEPLPLPNPGYSTAATTQFQPVRYPMDYPIAPAYPSQYQQRPSTGYGQPNAVPNARIPRNNAPLW